MWPFSLSKKNEIKYLISNYKKLNEYSDEELYEFLKNNNSTETCVLACICSEILRRQIFKD